MVDEVAIIAVTVNAVMVEAVAVITVTKKSSHGKVSGVYAVAVITVTIAAVKVN